MDKFEEREISKKRKFAENTCFNWYDIPEPLKNVDGAKDQIISLI